MLMPCIFRASLGLSTRWPLPFRFSHCLLRISHLYFHSARFSLPILLGLIAQVSLVKAVLVYTYYYTILLVFIWSQYLSKVYILLHIHFVYTHKYIFFSDNGCQGFSYVVTSKCLHYLVRLCSRIHLESLCNSWYRPCSEFRNSVNYIFYMKFLVLV
jgi:hypothetical protein